MKNLKHPKQARRVAAFLNTNYKPKDMNVFITHIYTHKVNSRDGIWLTDTRPVWWTVFFLFESGLFHVDSMGTRELTHYLAECYNMK